MHHRQQSPFFTFGWISILSAVSFVAVIASVTLMGCVASPFKAAVNNEQRAYALYGEFVIAEQQAAKLRAQISPTEFVTVQKADAAAKPIADSLLQAVEDFDQISAQVKAGTSTQDKLAIASADLQSWVAKAQTDITQLVNALKDARP